MCDFSARRSVLSGDEENFCRQVTDAIPYWGRYPFALETRTAPKVTQCLHLARCRGNNSGWITGNSDITRLGKDCRRYAQKIPFASHNLCLAKRSYTSEINDLAQSSIRSFPLKFFAIILSLRHFLGWLVSSFRCRADLVLENMALHRQLLALHAQRPRRRLTALHKLFWISLRMCWSRWRQPLVLVTPRTVVNCHRAGFRLYWTWVSRISQVGRGKRLSKEVRPLIFRIVAENPTWGRACQTLLPRTLAGSLPTRDFSEVSEQTEMLGA